MYDHDADEIELFGWDEFVTRQWASIFAGYRSWTGLRRIGRRWSDLIEAGLGCTQETADQLVRAEVIDRADRDLEIYRQPGALMRAMVAVVADLPRAIEDLAEEGWLAPGQAQDLRARQARLLALVRGLGAPDGGPAAEPEPRPGPGSDPDAEYA